MQSGISMFDLTSVIAEKRKEFEFKITIFKIIYNTLRTCQDNIPLLKTNFLEDKGNLDATELSKQIDEHCEQYPKSRTAKAWELTDKHYENCNEKNTVLFNEIYQYVCKNKTYLGIRIFSNSNNIAPLTEEQIQKADYYKDKAIYNIKFWLEYNTKEFANDLRNNTTFKK